MRATSLSISFWIHLIAAPALVSLPSALAAQAASGHAVGQSDSVKTLTAGEVDDLLSGAGMGLARPAELNGYPGPRHVLDLSDSLDLTARQRAATESLFEVMRDEAVELGRRILAAERELDAIFAAGSRAAPAGSTAETEDAAQRVVEQISRLRADLRWVHLRTHFRMRALLTDAQVQAYDRLRGYGHPGGPADHSGHHRE